MAWQVGEVMNHIRKQHLQKHTLVLFVNDHGPTNWGCQPAFNYGPFRGYGGSSWEGGMRGLALAWWPGRIKHGSVTNSLTSMMDIYPTVLNLAGNCCYLSYYTV